MSFSGGLGAVLAILVQPGFELFDLARLRSLSRTPHKERGVPERVRRTVPGRNASGR